MKITPIDIQQMVFQVKFRGFDRDEVNRFLEELALTVENLNRDNSALRDKLAITEQQVADLRRTESTLSNTLVSAQTIAEDVKRSAQREADLIVKEAELKASEIIRQARVSLSEMQRGVADLQKQRLMMVERFRSTLRSFERMLEVEESDAYQPDSDATRRWSCLPARPPDPSTAPDARRSRAPSERRLALSVPPAIPQSRAAIPSSLRHRPRLRSPRIHKRARCRSTPSRHP